ncbi:DUF4351 domain-containing protein [Crocosphaera watsonii WH 8501]|nr:DUF4351 domain-containing protein [Crocosphaera sp.]
MTLGLCTLPIKFSFLLLNTLEELGEALLDFQTETDLVNWLENNLN